jgi:1-deoxy-D-xylulose-5-phosphate reductoisomerase
MSAPTTRAAAIKLADNGERPLTCPQRLTVLGATGSIGESTLDLVGREPERFQVVALTAQSNAEKLARLAIQHRAEMAVVGDPACYSELKALLDGTGIHAAAGEEALLEAAERPADCTMAAIVGAAGLKPTFAAARQGRRVALANKECLVSAGDVFLSEIRASGAELLPVDSEHSAALQSLAGAERVAVELIVLTASGGPFRSWPMEKLKEAKPEEALRHPNWAMGAKITIDSATLMNKGLELIEAYHLFPVGVDQLDAVIHPQSVVHCLVHYIDGSVIAQLGPPDMRTPIALALNWPERRATPTARLDLVKIGSLTFEAVDAARFPGPGMAKDALRRGGSAPAILNAANEIAVAAFLGRGIGFLDIPRVVARALDAAEQRGLIRATETLEDVLAADAEGRVLAREAIETPH